MKSLSYRDNTVLNVRNHFSDLLLREQFVVDKTGVKMLEITGASFVADEEVIFGTVNRDYVAREIEWYESESLNVNDIPPPVPAIWKQVAGKTTGEINSNYGYLIKSPHNYGQFNHVLIELLRNPFSRRAVMIYTRPSIWNEYDRDGMSDFICTNAVQYFIRDGYLDVVVQMRSNDVTYGFKNDLAWQLHVRDELLSALNLNRRLRLIENPELSPGRIYWNAGSLHVYERDFYLVDAYLRKGVHDVDKQEYKLTFPDSPWSK